MTNSFFSPLSNPKVHRQVLALAIPMVLSNVTVPLLGLVDAAVIGHLEHAWYLGGVALGSTMISVTFWLLGFLRMSTTGLAAQAFGKDDRQQLALVFVQGGAMALLFAVLFLLAHHPIAELIFSWSQASAEVKYYGMEYFSIRVWSAPAALINFVILGWLLGTQNSTAPMWMVILTNLINIVLDVLFVIGLEWGVKGAALASVIADYSGLIFGLLCVCKIWRHRQLPSPWQRLRHAQHQIGRFIKLNRDIFLRSLCLQATFSFMTFQGASFGDDIVAANAVLMGFLMVISYGMDGFAYAIEAMVGKAIGAKDSQQLRDSLVGTFFWSVIICAGLTIIFALAGSHLIAMITSIDAVQRQASFYLPWLVAMPLVAMWCFLLDGIFVGATKGKEMRNSMFLATCCFFVIFYLFSSWQNHALWFAMTGFMLMRGIGLGGIFCYQWRKGQFLPSHQTSK
ncbi:MATE family efflux transporter [Vibrio azureus]|uniref:Multidrug resistance protein NorM n=1 Tax=Vibrio azureus NBRC 104587 TaxID=1219077 RepID=U3AV34_9VIBR|nr:MATE family efflux transporter DinF [Vibrio azureus]AUI87260.1 MATE family efflux transporter [Vibrio azureus]GAD77610.1 DNA-damage-inducible protein F [Vibrio azureus NBRC 104587]